MRFLLDENVPVSMSEMLEECGHETADIRDFVLPGTPDPVVATIAEDLEFVLISFDGDFEKIAPRIPDGQKRRFRKLSRIWMKCFEPDGANRLREALSLIQSEYALAQTKHDKRMHIWVAPSYIRTHR